MKTLRPIPLDIKERAIYQKHLTGKAEKAKKEAEADSAHQKHHLSLREIAIDMIGDYLVSSHSAGSEQASVRMSPLLNPLYLSYSRKYGVAYQMKIRSRYNFSAHRYLTFNPRFGYNFKFKQFYITAPLRMTYNPKRNGYVEMKIANGNPITNSTILDDIKHDRRDTIDFSAMQLDYFNDNYLPQYDFFYCPAYSTAIERIHIYDGDITDFSMPEDYFLIKMDVVVSGSYAGDQSYQLFISYF